MSTTAAAFSEDLVALFPGQGSVGAGSGRAWRRARHWDVVTRVSASTGVDVAYLLIDAVENEVVRTDHAQLATFALSLVGYYELTEHGVRPRYLVGHSLGEYSALVASGLLTLEEGARLIGARGAAMARAAATHDGSMVALMGGESSARDEVAKLEGVWIANINGPGQVVVSGSRDALAPILARHRELGWRRATELAVGGAFHSPLMAPAQAELDRALATCTWGTTDQVVISNVDGRVHVAPTEWRDLLSRQLTSPIEFFDVTLALPARVTRSVEVPPGAVLSGLVRRIRPFEHQYAPSNPEECGEVTP